MSSEAHEEQEGINNTVEIQPKSVDHIGRNDKASERETALGAEAVQRQNDIAEAEQIGAALNAQQQRFMYGFDNPVTKKYVESVMRANDAENTKPVKIDSKEGKKMMAMVGECEDLLRCLNDSQLHYSIDGAIGLSLRQLGESGSFLRQHRDIDLLVPEDELVELDTRLHTQEHGKGYGLFAWHTEEKASGMSFSKFDASHFKGNEMLVTMPVNDDGTPDMQRYNGLTMTDVHYLKKEGDTYSYNRLPVQSERLFQNEQVVLPNGAQTPVVSLVHMAVGKAKSDRPQDNYDLQYILKSATPVQKEEIRSELQDLHERTD